MVFSPIGRDCNIVWVKSYDEFCDYIKNNPMPDAICFDHDLGTEGNWRTFEENGYAAAKFLVNEIIGTKRRLPIYASQSSNPVGRENIISYLNNFVKTNPEYRPVDIRNNEIDEYGDNSPE